MSSSSASIEDDEEEEEEEPLEEKEESERRRKVVVKCSGLAGGKGVMLPQTQEDAIQALKEVRRKRRRRSHCHCHCHCRHVVVDVLLFVNTFTLGWLACTSGCSLTNQRLLCLILLPV
jgi:hypothetical protein